MVAYGEATRVIVPTFDVSVASVVKRSQTARSTGGGVAKSIGGRLLFALTVERGWLLDRIAEKPGITLRVLVRELVARDTEGQPYCNVALLRQGRHQLQENLLASERDGADVAHR